MPYKVLLHTSIIIMTTLLLAEVSTSLALFHLGYHSDGSPATAQFFGRVVKTLSGRAQKFANTRIHSDPAPLFAYNEKLGYSMTPGARLITISRNGTAGSLTLEFKATIWKDHSRATSYDVSCAKKHVHLFGDSQIWGWGNNDEQTMPWMLQSRYPNYRILNHAQVGYGNIHSLIQFEEIKRDLSKNDVFVVSYADYMNIRNVAAPSFLRSIDVTRWVPNYAERATFPYGDIDGGKLDIRHVGFHCKANKGWCDRNDPTIGHMHEVTTAILGRIFKGTEAKGVLLFLQGNDKDQVVAFARRQQIPVIDARSRISHLESDSLMPLDGHGGPITQYRYFVRLTKFLEENDWVSRDVLDVNEACRANPTSLSTQNGKKK